MEVGGYAGNAPSCLCGYPLHLAHRSSCIDEERHHLAIVSRKVVNAVPPVGSVKQTSVSVPFLLYSKVVLLVLAELSRQLAEVRRLFNQQGDRSFTCLNLCDVVACLLVLVSLLYLHFSSLLSFLSGGSSVFALRVAMTCVGLMPVTFAM